MKKQKLSTAEFYQKYWCPQIFFHTPEEVVELLTRLFNESGGNIKWRSLYIDHPQMNYWLKYIRIYRTDLGLVICNRDNYALRKEILKSKVNKEATT